MTDELDKVVESLATPDTQNDPVKGKPKHLWLWALFIIWMFSHGPLEPRLHVFVAGFVTGAIFGSISRGGRKGIVALVVAFLGIIAVLVCGAIVVFLIVLGYQSTGESTLWIIFSPIGAVIVAVTGYFCFKSPDKVIW